jgi:hypothetical protein
MSEDEMSFAVLRSVSHGSIHADKYQFSACLLHLWRPTLNAPGEPGAGQLFSRRKLITAKSDWRFNEA